MRREDHAVLMILGAGLLLRLPLIGSLGYPPDIAYWKSWLSYATEFGIWNVYQLDLPGQAYPPVMMILLYTLGSLYRLILPAAGDSQLLTAVVKLPAVIGDLAAAGLLAAIARRGVGERGLGPRGAATLLALHPAAIWLSSFWGQVDLLLGGLVVAAWWRILSRSPAAAGALLSLALFTKPQAMIILPAAVALLTRRCGGRGPARALAAGGIVAAALCLPFVFAGYGSKLVGIYTGAGNVYPYLSLSAFNPWGIVSRIVDPGGSLVGDAGFLLPGVSPKRIGLVLFLGATAWIAWRAWRTNNAGSAWRLLTLQWFAFFLLPTQIHERYLVPGLAGFAALVAHDRRWLAAFVATSVGVWLNLLLVAPGYPPIRGFVEAVTLHGGIVAAAFCLVAALLLRAELREGFRGGA